MGSQLFGEHTSGVVSGLPQQRIGIVTLFCHRVAPIVQDFFRTTRFANNFGGVLPVIADSLPHRGLAENRKSGQECRPRPHLSKASKGILDKDFDRLRQLLCRLLFYNARPRSQAFIAGGEKHGLDRRRSSILRGFLQPLHHVLSQK